MGWRTLSITLSTSFLLGITFTHWIADHNVLWTSPVTPAAISTSIAYYTILGNADSGLYWAWCSVATIALAAAGWRVGRGLGGVKGGEGGGWLFDGGSLVLLLAVLWTQISDVQLAIQNLTQATARHPIPSLAQMEQSEMLVKDLAGSHVFISVALTGVWLLQAGRYYSERADRKGALLHLEEQKSRLAAKAKAASQPMRDGAPKRATPYRELSEEESLGLGDADKGTKNSPEDGVEKRTRSGRKNGLTPARRR